MSLKLTRNIAFAYLHALLKKLCLRWMFGTWLCSLVTLGYSQRGQIISTSFEKMTIIQELTEGENKNRRHGFQGKLSDNKLAK